MAFLIGGANSAADGAVVTNSCRFNAADNACMYKAFGTPTSLTRWTISFWVKRGNLGAYGDGQQNVWGTISNDGTYNIDSRFNGTDNMRFTFWQGGSTVANLTTTQKFRDPAAWYHMVQVWDSGNATAGNRMRWYVNGAEVTSFSTDTNPSEDLESYWNSDGTIATIGSFRSPDGSTNTGTSSSGDYYLAEFVFCDGQAYTPSNFGEYDEDSPTIWKPKDVSGLTFGDNGFYLDFEDSSNLGNDKNGGTDFTEVNIAAADQATDTPVNNFCVMNPLDNEFAEGTFSEGNCKVVSSAGNTTWGTSTVGLSAGLWYFEIKIPATAGGGENIGIVDRVSDATSQKVYNASGGKNAVWRSGGALFIDDSDTTAYTAEGDLWTTTENAIMGVFIDLEANKIYIAKNGTIVISGVGDDLTAVASTLNNAYFILFGDSNTAATTFEFNFGGCSAFALSSAVSDSNGYGNFEYSPNQGGASNFDGAAKNFLAICTKNLGSDGG